MILRRYIHREIAARLGWIIGLLLLIVTGHRFIRYLGEAAEGKLPAELIIRLALMKALATLPQLLPVAIFLAAVAALSRLARDRELTVVSAAGGMRRTQLAAALQFSLLCSVLVFICSFFIAPWAAEKTQQLKARTDAESLTTGLRAGRFNELGEDNQVLYMERAAANGNLMENVFLRADGRDTISVLNSSRARYLRQDVVGQNYILFENGRRYSSSPNGLDYRVTRYKTYAVLVKRGGAQGGRARLEALPTATLLGSDQPEHAAELQWRLSFVLSSLLLPSLAVAMSRTAFGERTYLAICSAVLVYVIYSNLLSISKTLLKRAELPSLVGLWWVHLLLLSLIALAFQFPRRRRRARKMTAT